MGSKRWHGKHTLFFSGMSQVTIMASIVHTSYSTLKRIYKFVHKKEHVHDCINFFFEYSAPFIISLVPTCRIDVTVHKPFIGLISKNRYCLVTAQSKHAVDRLGIQ